MPAESNGLDLNLEDTLLTPGTPPDDEASLPSQQQAQGAVDQGSEGLQSGGDVTPPPASLPPGLLARAQQLGLPLDGIDSAERFAEYLADQYANLRPYADYGRSALAHPPNRAEAEAAQPQNDDAPDVEFNEDEFFSQAWTVPQLSPGAKWALEHGAFETNEQGMIVPSKEPHLNAVGMQYLREINDYQQAKVQQNEAFANNPVKFMAEKLLPYFEHKFSSKFSGMTEERLEQYENQSYEQKFIDQNKAWLLTPDGQNLSPDGVKLKTAIADLKARGFQGTVQELADYAMRFAGINPQAAAQPAQPAAPNPNPSATNTNTDQRPRDDQGRFLPAGTPAPEPPKTKQESFIDAARRKAGQEASQGSYTSGGEFNVANDGELENMFSNAYRQHSGAA